MFRGFVFITSGSVIEREERVTEPREVVARPTTTPPMMVRFGGGRWRLSRGGGDRVGCRG